VTDETRWKRFLRGLRARSPLVLVAAVALTALLLLGIQTLFTSGAFTHVRESLQLRTVRDDFVQDSYVIGRLKIDPPDRLPVYVMGGSTTREALVSEASFADALRGASGAAVHVYVLSNQNQTFAQSLAMVDNLPPGRGVVAIGINNNRFHFSPAEVALQARGLPLLLASPTLDRFLARNPPSGLPMARLPGILPGIMDFLVGAAGARFAEWAEGHQLGLSYKSHWVTSKKAWSTARKRAGVRQWISSHRVAFLRNYAYNARLLDVLVKRAKQRGYTVVLTEETENSAIVGHSFDQFKQVYQPIVRRIAAKYGVPYIDLQARLSLPNADFWDYMHMVEPGRVVWEGALAAALAPAIRRAAAASRGESAQALARGSGTMAARHRTPLRALVSDVYRSKG
jgi:hypothetical protein